LAGISHTNYRNVLGAVYSRQCFRQRYPPLSGKMTQFMIGQYFNAKRALNLTGPIGGHTLNFKAESASLNRK
jgi:hypothetical protein